MPPVEIEPTTPAGKRPQTYAFDRAALRCCPVQQIHDERRQARPVPQFLLSYGENCKMLEKSWYSFC